MKAAEITWQMQSFALGSCTCEQYTQVLLHPWIALEHQDASLSMAPVL